MNTNNYIDKAKEQLGAKSDYALSKKTGISEKCLSQYRNGLRTMDDYTAAKLAEVLKINPLEVIAAANAEREKDAKKREFWIALQRNSQHLGIAIVLMVTGSLGLIHEHTDDTYYALCALAIIAGLLLLNQARCHEKKHGYGLKKGREALTGHLKIQKLTVTHENIEKTEAGHF